ncbi:helix-turn-helix transcriptional regulator [Clostridium sp. MSJ-11]|uniref:Helix-turn-helix transcriptional regulator n=1 Tax=Clostridium mobile TaxID=2841512 RepID=A0ABS6EMI1_9CLOT|nr:helix-turn-helix transcriptional regulator [Clostridium mobile]MBU5486439.1 helix-turn-helix transcriptional regulator [Clostridium mobile]
MRIGDLIKTKRMEKGLSQDQLAQLIGSTQRVVSNWEANKNEPSPVYIPKLSNTLNIPLEELTSTPELFSDFAEKKEDNKLLQLINALHETEVITSDNIDENTQAIIISMVKKYLKEKEGRD